MTESDLWRRLTDDFLSTTGRELIVSVIRNGEGWATIEVRIDGQWVATEGRGVAESGEAQLAEVADLLRELVLDEEIWGGWPICPDHRTHPLEASLDVEGMASWFCPVGGRRVAAIGSLRATA